MKIILSSFLALSLLTAGAFAASPKDASGKSHSSRPHRNSTGKHRGSSINRKGAHQSTNIPSNAN